MRFLKRLFGSLGGTAEADLQEQHDRFMMALQRERFEKAGRIIDATEDVNTRDETGSTFLHLATLYGVTDLVHKLLDREADVNARNDEKQTPLWNAITSGSMKIFAAVLGAGAKVDYKDAYGMTLVEHAADSGEPEMTQKLLELGAEAEDPDELLREAKESRASATDANTAMADWLAKENADSKPEPIFGPLKLTPCSPDQFEYPRPIESWTEDLQSVGFDVIGDFQSIERGFVCRGLIHPADCLIALLYEKDALSWGEMITPYEDETYAYHTANLLASDESPEWQILTSEDVEPEEQYELAVEDRADKPMRDVTPEGFLAIVCQRDQRIQDWRRENE